jgi:hypothetical protein
VNEVRQPVAGAALVLSPDATRSKSSKSLSVTEMVVKGSQTASGASSLPQLQRGIIVPVEVP